MTLRLMPRNEAVNNERRDFVQGVSLLRSTYDFRTRRSSSRGA
jgi:hypothetical protein